MSLNPVAKESMKELSDALKLKKSDTADKESDTIADFMKKLMQEPDKKVRKQMVKDFSASRSDAVKFLKDNEELINSEAEIALINAAVGSTIVEKEISYAGGKRTVKTRKKVIPPNTNALNIYLKNKMPDKYSDKPQTEIEVENLDEIEKELYSE